MPLQRCTNRTLDAGQPAVFPLKAHTHPQAQQHKMALCFALSLHRSPQTGMFERRVAVVGQLAGAPRLLLASCPSGAGTQPGASNRCQVGQWSSGGRLAAQEKQSRVTADLQPCTTTAYDQNI